MEKQEKQLPKATAEIAKEYEELNDRLRSLDPSWPADEVNTISQRMCDLEEQYDWQNVIFLDPETGKKGVKDVAGHILIPARYDEVLTLGSYMYRYSCPHAVKKDGKVGIVKADGSGNEISGFRFDDVSWLRGTDLFVAKWDGDKEHYGFIDAHGDVVCPNILTGFSEAEINNIIFIESHGKYGVIDADTHLCVLPEYDDVESSPDDFIVFRKDGKEGYITNKGVFVTKEQYENEEDKYGNEYYLNCMAE